MRTLFTLHLYLNDSVAAAEKLRESSAANGDDRPMEEKPDLVGGATSFLSYKDEDARVDVDPLCGRVLIFQQNNLLHSGDDVLAGTKYTMRTELMFELVDEGLSRGN